MKRITAYELSYKFKEFVEKIKSEGFVYDKMNGEGRIGVQHNDNIDYVGYIIRSPKILLLESLYSGTDLALLGEKGERHNRNVKRLRDLARKFEVD